MTPALAVPSLLLGLAALVALHWRRRGRAAPVRLPTARFVPTMPVTESRAGGLLRPGLWALRAAMATALGLAAVSARSPEAAPAPAPAEGPAALLVVDASGSMAQRSAGGTALGGAVAAAKARLREHLAAGRTVGLWIGQVGGEPLDVPPTRDARALEAALDGLRAAGGAALAGACARAERAHTEATSADVFTDGAGHAWADGAPPARLPWRLHAVVPPGADNDAVVAVGTLPAGAGAVVLEATVARYGRARGARSLRWTLDGEVVERARVAPRPGVPEVLRRTVSLAAGAGDRSTASLLLAQLEPDAGDALAADDVRGAWLPPTAGGHMLALVDAGRSSEEPADYWLRALAQPPAGGTPTPVRLLSSPAALAAEPAVPLLVADAGGLVAAPAAAALVSGADRRPLMQALGPSAAAPRPGQAAPPVIFGRPRDARGPTDGPAGGRRLGKVAWQHPLLADLDPLARASLQQARVYRWWQLEDVPSSAVPIMALEDGSPLLWAREAGDQHGRQLVWTSTLSPQWTDWPLRSAFVPWTQAAYAWLAGGRGSLPRAVDWGEPFVWREGSEALVPAVLTSAGGTRVSRPARTSGAADGVSLRELGRWRADRVQQSGAERAASLDVWINAPAGESDLGGGGRGSGAATAAVPGAAANASRPAARYPWLLLVAFLLALDGAAAPSASSPKKAAWVGVVPRD